MINNYDKIAKHYDFLSRLVFSKSQVKPQVNQLHHISQNSTILIVGGGSGWILEEITAHHHSGLKIIYVEISAQMIALSKQRNCGDHKLQFVNSGIEAFESDHNFDVILTPFLFDNFSKERAELVFRKLDRLLKENGLWLMTDFSLQKNKGNWWKKPFLKLMYLFFNSVGNVEAKCLVDMKPHFLRAAYQTLEEVFYYSGFIQASVFKKSNNKK